MNFNYIYLNIIKMNCPICREDKKCIMIDCKHKFCESCITTWSNISNKCPLCRSPFTITNSNNIIIGSVNKFIITLSKYINSDKMRTCVNHNLTIHKPFGVFIKCNDCNKNYCFNYKG